jgi:hypothetical protein
VSGKWRVEGGEFREYGVGTGKKRVESEEQDVESKGGRELLVLLFFFLVVVY